MKLKLSLLFSLLLFATVSVAQSRSDYSSSSSYPPPNRALPGEDTRDYYQTSNGGWIDVKGAAKSEAERKKTLESLGYTYSPPQEGIEGYVETEFTMPQGEGLVGCMYTATYSYPDLCLEDGKVIFDIERGDRQKELDKIIKKQGKQGGKYNKLPKILPDLE